MSTTKELGEAWYGCQAEIKHLKAVIKLKEYIRTLKRKEMRRQQRDKKKRDAEKKEVKNPEKTLIFDNMVGDVNVLCAVSTLSENTVINYF